MDTLFELPGLDSIDWSSLSHAYGEASGTAKDIRNLASPDPKTQEIAVSQLDMSICHQGSLYPATVAAVPFLLTAAEHLSGDAKSHLLWLIASIGESAAISPGDIAEFVYNSWTLWSDPTSQPDPRQTAIDNINTYRAVLALLLSQMERFTSLVVEEYPELPKILMESAQLKWSGDFLTYATALASLEAGVVQTVLMEPVTISYRALAEKLDPMALSGTILWWALEQELASDEFTLLIDSLARDINEHISLGWKIGEQWERQKVRLWRAWRCRFLDKSKQITKVQHCIEQRAKPGWLPQSCEDRLLIKAIEIGFGVS